MPAGETVISYAAGVRLSALRTLHPARSAAGWLTFRRRSEPPIQLMTRSSWASSRYIRTWPPRSSRRNNLLDRAQSVRLSGRAPRVRNGGRLGQSRSRAEARQRLVFGVPSPSSPCAAPPACGPLSGQRGPAAMTPASTKPSTAGPRYTCPTTAGCRWMRTRGCGLTGRPRRGFGELANRFLIDAWRRRFGIPQVGL